MAKKDSDLISQFSSKSIIRLQEEANVASFLNFADNENAWGPAPEVLEDVRQSVNKISHYPDGECYQLVKELSSIHKIDQSEIFVGNGVMEILRYLNLSCGTKSGEILFSQGSFIQYKIASIVNELPFRETSLVNNAISLDNMLNEVTDKTNMIFLSNPNNPTASYFSQKSFDDFLAKVPKHIYVVLDESYADFSTAEDVGQGEHLLKSNTNLIVLKTFSKLYGLPGLRLGYVMAATSIIKKLARLAPPYSINQLAQEGALSALKYPAYYQQVKTEMSKEGLWLQGEFKAMGFSVNKSPCNFLFIDLGKYKSLDLFDKLKAKGILVKSLTSYGFPHHHRITIRKRSDNIKLIEAYKNLWD